MKAMTPKTPAPVAMQQVQAAPKETEFAAPKVEDTKESEADILQKLRKQKGRASNILSAPVGDDSARQLLGG